MIKLRSLAPSGWPPVLFSALGPAHGLTGTAAPVSLHLDGVVGGSVLFTMEICRVGVDQEHQFVGFSDVVDEDVV